MTVGEFLEKIENPDRLRIVQQGEDIFVGFLGMLNLNAEALTKIKDREIVKFRAIPEIRHKKWNELNLTRPLEPDETPDFSFSDLEMKLYYTIHVGREVNGS